MRFQSTFFLGMALLCFWQGILGATSSANTCAALAKFENTGQQTRLPPPSWSKEGVEAFLRGLRVDEIRSNRLSGPPPSLGITREGKSPLLKGVFDPELSRTSGHGVTLVPRDPAKGTQGGKDLYVEVTNGSIFETTDLMTGLRRVFILARGVPPYSTVVKPDGSIEPQGYRSDAVLFEVKENGIHYVSTLIHARPDLKFFPEDFRVAQRGDGSLFVLFTDYSPHMPSEEAHKNSPDVLNVMMPLKVNAHGLPVAPDIESQTGRPINLHAISPRPLKEKTTVLFTDAKNANFFENEDGTVTVKTRLRPNFKDPRVQSLARGQDWGEYSVQVFKFKSWEDFQHYNFDHALEDIFGAKHKQEDANRVRPLVAKVLYEATDIHRVNPDPRLVMVRHKGRVQPRNGVGPGAQSIGVWRKGNHLYFVEGKGANPILADELSEKESRDFILKDGDFRQFSLEHDIQWFIKSVRVNDGATHGFIRRNYEAPAVLYSEDGTSVIAYYAGALQPELPSELGLGSGISDLNHVYPMSRRVKVISPTKGQTTHSLLQYSIGTSDANVALVNVDIKKILLEMSDPEHNPRWRSGQIFVPGSGSAP